MSEERLNRYLARTGIGSRRACDRLIQEGRVQVNGETVDHPGTRVDPERDEIRYGGRVVRPPDVCTYLVLNKPAGYLVSAGDPHHDRTVFDLLKDVSARVFPVGRLDIDTMGVLLLTDDGDLAYRLTHPKYGVEKAYVADVKGEPGPEALKKLREGVELEDGVTAPAEVRALGKRRGGTAVELVIHEGRNRQVKRMCEAVGYPVRRLERIRFGTMTVTGLNRGDHRALKAEEVRALKAIVGLRDEDREGHRA